MVGSTKSNAVFEKGKKRGRREERERHNAGGKVLSRRIRESVIHGEEKKFDIDFNESADSARFKQGVKGQK